MTSSETTFTVSGDTFSPNASFSVDVGNTCCKVASIRRKQTRHEHRMESRLNNESDEVLVRLMVVNGKVINEDIVKCIRDEQNDGDVTEQECRKIYCTGFHVRGENRKVLEQAFNVRIELLAEIDCSVRGMELMLHSVAENEAMFPPASNGIAEAMRDAHDMIRIQTTFKDQTDQEQTGSETATSEQDAAKFIIRENQSDCPLSENVADLYPYILVTCGSACIITLVESPTNYRIVEGSSRCGRTFLSLSHLIIGEKEYGTIMGLAERGDESNISSFHRDLRPHTAPEDDDAYLAIPDGLMLFSLDKVLHPNFDISSLDKADMARALVHLVAEDVAQGAFWAARALGAHHVFMTGGLVGHQTMRDAVTKHFLKRCHMTISHCNLHFMKHGTHIGAIGALLKS